MTKIELSENDDVLSEDDDVLSENDVSSVEMSPQIVLGGLASM